MKQQVVAIHGGTSFDTYDDYIAFLRTREVNLEKLMQCDDWRSSLFDELGDDYEVLVPKMPNGTNVKYLEWCIWFERCLPFMRHDVILIGHSLGGIFLAKYLAEHAVPITIKATILIAAPFDKTLTVESLTDFVLPETLDALVQSGGKIYLIHSKDDPVVPYEEVEVYHRLLPQSQILSFDDRQHFNQKHFPELVELVKSF